MTSRRRQLAGPGTGRRSPPQHHGDGAEQAVGDDDGAPAPRRPRGARERAGHRSSIAYRQSVTRSRPGRSPRPVAHLMTGHGSPSAGASGKSRASVAATGPAGGVQVRPSADGDVVGVQHDLGDPDRRDAAGVRHAPRVPGAVVRAGQGDDPGEHLGADAELAHQVARARPPPATRARARATPSRRRRGRVRTRSGSSRRARSTCRTSPAMLGTCAAKSGTGASSSVAAAAAARRSAAAGPVTRARWTWAGRRPGGAGRARSR